MLNEINNFYLKQSEPNRSCFMALRKKILSLNSDITEEWKYKLPFFCFKKKMFCYLWQDKKTREPYVGIVRSKDINHPKLFIGSRKKMKIYQVNPNEDIEIEELLEILNEALTYY